MTTTVTRLVDTQQIKITYDHIRDDVRYTPLLINAHRAAKTAVDKAIRLNGAALAQLARLPAATDPRLDRTYVENLQTYFCLPAPTHANALLYRRSLVRIGELLCRVRSGMREDGLTFQRIEQRHLNMGFKGIVIVGAWERMKKYRGTDDTHRFDDAPTLKSDVYLMFQLLQQDFSGAVNTIVHECTHKFGHTVDHCYFGNFGMKHQRHAYWMSAAMAETFVAYDVNYFANPANQDKYAAIAAIKAGIATTINQPAASLQVSMKLRQVLAKIDATVQQRMARYTDTDSYAELTTEKALNNADSFSCYVMDMPDTIV